MGEEGQIRQTVPDQEPVFQQGGASTMWTFVISSRAAPIDQVDQVDQVEWSNCLYRQGTDFFFGQLMDISKIW